MADSFISQPGASNNGIVATASSALGGIISNIGKLATDALADQWGLNKGNGINQNLYNTNTQGGTGGTTNAGLVDVTATPNTILTLGIVAVIFIIALRG